MKKIFIFALTGLLVASCASDDFEGDNNALKTGNGEITFSMSTPNVTRGTADDAEKLGNEFVVYGWKQSSTQVVFDNYTLKYSAGTANQTLSNTNGWEYVGYTTQPFAGGVEVEQSIKYWDYSAEQYNFLAWRILSGSATANGLQVLGDDGRKEGTTTEVYKDTALLFQAPTAQDLAKIYISNQKTVVKSNTNYKQAVELTFRNLSAKVRLGIYETVPGYSVKDVKFYPSASGSSADTPQLFVTSTSTVEIPTAGNVLVKYQKADNVAVAKTTSTASTKIFQNGSSFSYGADPENKESSSDKYVGRTSKTATYPSADIDGYTYAFPHDALELNLKVDYTLVSIDGKGETIKVTGAKAVVPTQYGQWKANYAYTYLFKISDKTNGTTGGSGDPESLYPITFDACVEVTADGNSQETVTTLTTPTFTTYQGGVNVTNVSEYNKDEDIYVTLYDQSTSAYLDLIPSETGANVKLYSLVSADGTELTEANVANYANNGIILTNYTEDLSYENAENKTLVKFKAKEGKTYAVEYTSGSYKYYKVIKVAGTATTTYKLNAFATGTTTPVITEITEGSSFDVKVNEGDDVSKYPVTNAAKFFTADTYSKFDITESSTPGTYTFTAKAGITANVDNASIEIKNGTTSLGSTTITTIQAYKFNESSVDVIAGTNNSTITLYLGGSAATDIDAFTDFTITGSDLSISSVADGVVTIQAENSAVTGTGSLTYSNNGIVVATATINIKAYSFEVASGSSNIINIGSKVANEQKSILILKLGTENAGENVTVTNTLTSASGTTVSTQTDNSSQVVVDASSATEAGSVKVAAPDGKSIDIVVTNFKATVYDAETGGSEVTTDLTAGVTYYVRFTGMNNYTGIEANNVTLTSTSTAGVYQFVAPSASETTIKYTYSGVTFTLCTATISTPAKANLGSMSRNDATW